MKKTFWIILPIAIGIFALACDFLEERSFEGFPGEKWERVEPESVGLDRKALTDFTDYIGGSGAIIRSGKMVHAWGYYDYALDVASAVKPVYAHLVYLSIREGIIESLDSPVSQFQPRLKDLNRELEYKDAGITWRHLLSQTSCYSVQEKPADAFDYNDFQTALLIDTLVFKVFKTGYGLIDDNICDPMLWDRIGCQDDPTLHGTNVPPGRLRISPRDFARFGLLYLNRGRWAGEQVLPERFAIQAVSSPHPGTLRRTSNIPAEMLSDQRSIGAGKNQESHMNSYSYSWWLNGIADDGSRIIPDAPRDTFSAIGHAGRDALVVIPSMDMVVCWIDGVHATHARGFSRRGRLYFNSALKKLVRSVKHPSRETDLKLAGENRNVEWQKLQVSEDTPLHIED